MMKLNIILTALALASLAGAASLPVLAKPDNDAHDVIFAKIYLKQAVDTAEQQVNGVASRASFEQEKTGPVYEVEVVTQTKIYDVKIDANKGTVLATREDKKDHDEDREEEHHNEDHQDKD